MSKRLDVLQAVKALAQVTYVGAEVLALDGQDAAPGRVGPLGRIVIRSGDLGDPEVDLSPLRYHYEHRIPVEVVAYQTSSLTSEQVVDAMLVSLGAAIEADRTLGGLCDWVEATAPMTDDIYVEGARPPKGADLVIVASYSTTNPLT
ncbi:hypothetical protein [Sphingomonas sp.]|uniref:hypothetical protein n=1 Tax=Sphingomonas sp. TaxID=28214 RepID=UPI003AFF8712